jgi:hypothetical protein
MAAGRLADPVRHAQRQREPALPPEHVAALGELVHDLVHGAGDEVGEVHVHHRPHPGHGRPHRRADDGGLRDRRVEDALGAEGLAEPLGHAEGNAGPDVLADQVHALVAGHLLAERGVEGVAIGQLGHGGLSRRSV